MVNIGQNDECNTTCSCSPFLLKNRLCPANVEDHFFSDKGKYLEINLLVLVTLMKIEKQFVNVKFGILCSSSFSKGFGIEVSWVY